MSPPDTEAKPPATARKYLFDSVFSQTQLSRHYIVQLVFSTIITTLGIITNNTAVVIGAMLISPLFWPVLGIALGIITTRKNILKDAAISFSASVVMVLFFSTIITVLLPVNDLNPEITSRINPNTIDLFIALAASVLGVFSLYYPTISATAAGVAISISLLPPLCVAGIGVASLSSEIVGKSLLLFGTNIGAIVFMGVIALYLLKIRPRKAKEEVRFKYGVFISGILMAALSIPLTIYFKESLNQNIITGEVNRIINQNVKEISSEARVGRVNIDLLSISEDTPLAVDAVVYLPEGVYITQAQKQDLLDQISTVTNKNVSLEIDIISTLSLQSEEDQQKNLLKQSIREIINQEMRNLDKDIVIDEISIKIPDTRTDPDKQDANIVVRVKQFGEVPLSYEDLQNIKSFLEFKLDITANIEIELLPISRLRESAIETDIYRRVDEGLEEILLEIDQDIYIDELSIRENEVYVKLFVPNYIYINQQARDDMAAKVNEVLGEEFGLKLQIVRYELQ